MNYAIVENGIVTNIIYLHPMNANDFPNAVAVEDVLVHIGDTYVDGVFYRGEEKVLTKVERLRIEMADMEAALAELGVTADE